jgi:hypothetical protein
MTVTLKFDPKGATAMDVVEAGRQRGAPYPLQPLRPYDYNIPKSQGGRETPGAVSGVQQAIPVGYPDPSQPRYGTMIIPRPSKPHELKVMSWNSGFPAWTSNDSHAERFFLQWFENAGISHAVKDIQIEISWSPCSACAAALSGIAGRIPGHLHYSAAYKGYDKKTGVINLNSSTVEDMSKIAKWAPGGGTPVTLTDAKKQEEYKNTVFNYTVAK